LNGAIGIIKKVVPEALDLLIKRRNRGAEKEMWSVPYFLPDARWLNLMALTRRSQSVVWRVSFVAGEL
jgi:hypothetical protein